MRLAAEYELTWRQAPTSTVVNHRQERQVSGGEELVASPGLSRRTSAPATSPTARHQWNLRRVSSVEWLFGPVGHYPAGASRSLASVF
jgi:hypothetical protein